MQIISGDRVIDRPTFESHVLSVASGLKGLGIGEDDAVLVLMRNDIEFLEASHAIARLGAFVVPLNWHGTTDDIAFVAADCGATCAITHVDLIPLLAKSAAMPIVAVPVAGHVAREYGAASATATLTASIPWQSLLETPPADLPPKAAREPIIYTSGTTGKPKGVRRFTMEAAAAERMRQMLASAFGLSDGMRTLVVSPLYHSGPASYLRAAMATMRTDGLVVIHPKFDAVAVLQAFETHRIDRLWMVPTMFVALLKLASEVRERYDVSSLRHVLHTAAPCPVEVKRRMIEWFGPVINEFYGSTEVGPVAVATSQDAIERPGTVGRITPDSDVAIVGEDGTHLGPSEIGEIAARNRFFPNFTYWNREADRRALDRRDLMATGDVGYRDQDGYLFLCDRKSHMIISGGVNIYPAEIEAVVLEHPSVKDCAVFGIPDERFGEAVALAVELAHGAAVSEADVSAFLKGRVASYKMPKLIQFHEALPREDTGKIFKRVLRQPFWQQTGRSI